MTQYQFRGWVGLTPELQDDVREILGKSNIRQSRLIEMPYIDDDQILLTPTPDFLGTSTSLSIIQGVNHRHESLVTADTVGYTRIVGAILLRVHVVYPAFKVVVTKSDIGVVDAETMYKGVFGDLPRRLHDANY